MYARIVSDSAVLGGKPVVKGTRISVEFLLELFASGATRADVLKSYPHLAAEDVQARFGEEAIRVDDPSGLRFELIASDRDPRAPWTGGGVDAGAAIRGLHSVTMVVRDLRPTLELMSGLLGYKVVDEREGWTRVAVGGDGPGHAIDIHIDPGAPAAINVSSRSSSDGLQGLSLRSIRPRPVKPVSTCTTG